MKKDIAVVGGGFFGIYISHYLAEQGFKVKLFEKEAHPMTRASFNNQARVHNGYHYPRSILTAFRSRVSFPKFSKEFESSIDHSFVKYYAIPKSNSKISGRQFQKFCEKIGAHYEDVPSSFKKLLNSRLIDSAFLTHEFAFNAVKLREEMLDRISRSDIEFLFNTEVTNISSAGNKLDIYYLEKNKNIAEKTWAADHVFNCTYSMVNNLAEKLKVPLIPLKHELTEIVLVRPPEEIKKIGITVMDGPFFSTMPFPSTDYHSFSHVRYTPHCDWEDKLGYYQSAHEILKEEKKVSKWRHMQFDAKRFIPILGECEYQDSLWEVKTVLQKSELNDSRPILFKQDHGIKGFHCLLGGKIDNIYDIIDLIQETELLND